MILKRDAYYKTRDGRREQVIYIGKTFALSLGDDGDVVRRLVDGRFCVGSHECVADLVSEWIDSPVIDWSRFRPWVKAVAMDSNLKWWEYAGMPTVGVGLWSQGEHFFRPLHPSDCPAFSGNWKDSLCIRPEEQPKPTCFAGTP